MLTGHPGVDHSRVDRIDADAECAELGPRPNLVIPRIANLVPAYAVKDAISGEALHRGAVDDRALTALLHARCDGLHAEEAAAHVDLDEQVEVVERHCVDLAEAEDAGVVDEDVDGSAEELSGPP